MPILQFILAVYSTFALTNFCIIMKAISTFLAYVLLDVGDCLASCKRTMYKMSLTNYGVVLQM